MRRSGRGQQDSLIVLDRENRSTGESWGGAGILPGLLLRFP